MKLNQKGAIDMMLVAALAIVLAVGGFVLYRITQTEEIDPNAGVRLMDSEADDESVDSDPGTDSNELVSYDDTENGISFEYPSSWTRESCAEDSFILLTEGESVKCGTENYIKGPTFIFNDELVVCDEVEDNPVQTATCEDTTIGDKNVRLVTYTYVTEGEFGGSIGDISYQYIFLDDDFRGWSVSYTQVKDAPSLKSDMDKLLESFSIL